MKKRIKNMSFRVFLAVFCAKIGVIFAGIYLFDSFNKSVYASPLYGGSGCEKPQSGEG
jgi:hypothetical protein